MTRQTRAIARYVQDERPSIPALTHMHTDTDHATDSVLPKFSISINSNIFPKQWSKS